MGRRLWVIGLALCAVAPVSRAATDLFGFMVSNPRTEFNTTTSQFSVSVIDDRTIGAVSRNGSSSGDAWFGGLLGTWGAEGDFSIAMTISDVTTSTTNGVGTFAFTDVDGDVISGNVDGSWVLNTQNAAEFRGALSNVTVSSNSFDGVSGSVSMAFSSDQPWIGSLVEVTVGNVWFTSSFATQGGSVDATVSAGDVPHAPAPGALILALCGMVSAAGLKRRGSL